MSPGTLPAPGRPRAWTARAAMLAFLAALLAVDAAAEGVRVEPQIGPHSPRKVEFHPTERFLLLVVEGDGQVGLWDVEDKERYVRLLTIYTNAADACFSADGETIVTGGRDGRVRLWDRDGVQVWETEEGHDGRVRNVAASSDVLASSEFDGTVRLWNLDGSARGDSLRGHQGWVNSVSFSPSGDVLASAGAEDATVRLWNLDGSARGEPLRGHEGEVNSVSFSPSGDFLASSGDDGTVRLWNLDGSARGEPLRGHEGEVNSVSFSPSGDFLASSGYDGTVRLWNLDGNARGEPLRGHEGSVWSVSFSPSGDFLASSGDDGTIRLWKLEDKTPTKPILKAPGAFRVGFFRSSLYTLSFGSILTLFDKEFQPIARMTLTADGTIGSTSEGWYSGDGSLLNDALLFPDGHGPPLTSSQALRRYRPEEVIATIRGRTWWQFLRVKVLALWRRATEKYAALPQWGKAAFWPTAGYVVLGLTIFMTFLFRPAVLAGLTMPSLTQPELPKWKSWTQALALIRSFGATQRALDAWLRTHEKTLDVRVFAGKESVETRNRYVDLGNEDDLAAWQVDATSGKAAACWITGPGGCGKSTLAFRMARDLHDGARRRRHPVLPIVVEEDWHGSLVDHLSERLRIADRRPSAWMVTKLAHTGRLVPIVDGLSERRLADASEQVAALWRQGVFRHLLLTSRADEPPDADFRKVEVGALDASRLPAFVGAYVAGGEVDTVVKALGAFGRGEPIRPLFAWLAIEQLREDGELPSTFVGLVDRYLRRLRPPGFREAGFLRAARKAAEASVEDALAPRAVGEDYLCGFLANEEVAFSDDDGDPLTPQRVVDHLVRCGLLERVKELGTNRVRFVADPIAELLYAKSFVDRGGSKLRELRRLLAGGGENVGGLRDALEQVEAS